MTSRTTYFVILGGAILWCGLIFLAPYLASVESPMNVFIYRTFHPICHQLPERSFYMFGEKLAVCSRCASIYFAFLVGVLAYPLVVLLTRPSHSVSRRFLWGRRIRSFISSRDQILMEDSQRDRRSSHRDSSLRPDSRSNQDFVQNDNTPPRFILFSALLPMVIDVGLDMLGLHESTFVTRSLTGALFGCVVVFFVVPTALEGVYQLSSPKPTIIDHQKGISNA
ncbi:MAG: DUF2085 domain-containing protein [Ignavibacteriae bacterium]|nr:DUF2085 domain-containing protein [Ignavibacteriota bacterium]